MEKIDKLKYRVLLNNPHFEEILIDNSIKMEMDSIEQGTFIVYNHDNGLYELHSVFSLINSHEDDLHKSYQVSFNDLNFDLPEWMYRHSVAIVDADTQFEEMHFNEDIYKDHEKREFEQFQNYMKQVAKDNLKI